VRAAVRDRPAPAGAALYSSRLPGGFEAWRWVRNLHRSPFAVNPPSETFPARALAFFL
jgi:hypothetical protein